MQSSCKTSEKAEQRVCIKFCFRIGKNAGETFILLKRVYGDEAMSRTQVYEWYRRFKDGRTSTDSDPRSGRPATSRNDEMISKVLTVVRRDRRLTVHELAKECGISMGSCSTILMEDLQMKRVSGEFVPRVLAQDQRELRLSISNDLFDRSNENIEFLRNIITGDEIWIYGYDLENKHPPQSSIVEKRARKINKRIKVMLIAYFDWEGLIHYEYVPADQIGNKKFYVEVLERLYEAVRLKRKEKWKGRYWMLHYDDTLSHSSECVQQFLAKYNISKIQQPPNSPDLAPCNYFLFRRLRKIYKHQQFNTVEELQRSVTNSLLEIQKIDFAQCFQEWHQRWAKCMAVKGDYFEGENL